jgi:hypothetical protein
MKVFEQKSNRTVSMPAIVSEPPMLVHDQAHRARGAPSFFDVILTKRATRAAGRISDSFAPAKPVPVSEIAKRSLSNAAAKASAVVPRQGLMRNLR